MAPRTVSFANGSDARRITVWGAPTTGKTTFLAALNVALERQNEPWRVIGTNEAAAEALARFERALVRDRMFPEATQGLELYSWELMGRSNGGSGDGGSSATCAMRRWSSRWSWWTPPAEARTP